MSHRSHSHSSSPNDSPLASETSRTYTYPQGTFIAPAPATATVSNSESQVRAFLANPTVHRSADNKGYQCPLCPQVVLDSYPSSASASASATMPASSSSSSSPSSSPRRQVRTEALKEHLGVKHNLLPKHPCPFRTDTKCKSNPHGFVKSHRLANHIFDNAQCRASAVAALDSATDADASVASVAGANDDKLDAIRWALGPRARSCTVKEVRALFKVRVEKRLGVALVASTAASTSGDQKAGGKRRSRVVDAEDVENHPPPTFEASSSLPSSTDMSSESSSGSNNKRRRTMATTKSEVEFTRFWSHLHSDLPSSSASSTSSFTSSTGDNCITFTLSPPTSPTSTPGVFSDLFSALTDTTSSFSSIAPKSSTTSATTSPCPFQTIQVPTPLPSPLVLPTTLTNPVLPAPMPDRDPLMLAALGATTTFDMPIIAAAPPAPATSPMLPLGLASKLDCGLFYSPPLVPPAIPFAQISPFTLAPMPAAAATTTTPSFLDFDWCYPSAASATIAPALTYTSSTVAAPLDDHDVLSAYLFGPPTPPARPAVGNRVRSTSIKDRMLAQGEHASGGVDPVLLALFGMENGNEKNEAERAGGLERCLSISDVLLSEFV